MTYLSNEGDLYLATVTVEVLFRAEPMTIGSATNHPRDVDADGAAAWHAVGLLSYLYDAHERITEAGHPFIGMDLSVTGLERLSAQRVEHEWKP